MSKDKKKEEKEEKHKIKNKAETNYNELSQFDALVKKNKANGKPWYYGLQGKWWWGKTESESRKRIESKLNDVKKGNAPEEKIPDIKKEEKIPDIKKEEKIPDIKKE